MSTLPRMAAIVVATVAALVAAIVTAIVAAVLLAVVIWRYDGRINRRPPGP